MVRLIDVINEMLDEKPSFLRTIFPCQMRKLSSLLTGKCYVVSC